MRGPRTLISYNLEFTVLPEGRRCRTFPATNEVSVAVASQSFPRGSFSWITEAGFKAMVTGKAVTDISVPGNVAFCTYYHLWLGPHPKKFPGP